MKIEVCGPGCKRCHTTLKNVQEAVKELNLNAEIEYITDMKQMMDKGVMFTPAVIIDGVIKSSGKVPTVAEIKKWLS
ncbi:MAG: thioredoxin family protein [bacterium]|nr:thioredoxin family protein [bacterium]